MTRTDADRDDIWRTKRNFPNPGNAADPDRDDISRTEWTQAAGEWAQSEQVGRPCRSVGGRARPDGLLLHPVAPARLVTVRCNLRRRAGAVGRGCRKDTLWSGNVAAANPCHGGVGSRHGHDFRRQSRIGFLVRSSSALHGVAQRRSVPHRRADIWFS